MKSILYCLLFVLSMQVGGTQSAQAQSQRTIRALTFPMSLVGYAVGYEGLLLKTIDGGMTWEKLEPPLKISFLSLYFFDANRGIIAGDNRRTYMTKDGGKTWKLKKCTNCDAESWTSAAMTIDFASPSTGFIAGGNGLLMRTYDGGETWQQIPTNLNSGFNKLEAFGSDGFRAAGNAMSMFYWKKGGTLIPLNDDKDVGIMDFQFIDSKRGFAVGKKGMAYYTLNGGAQWTSIPTGKDKTLFRSILAKDGLVYAVGNKETILVSKDFGKNWITIAPPSLQDGSTLFTIKHQGERLFIAGDKNAFFYSDNKGRSWVPVQVKE